MGKLERYIIGGIIAATILFLIWFFSNIVTYILIAAVISLMGKPLVDLLCRLKFKSLYMPKWIASSIVIAGLWAIAIILTTIFVPIVYSKLQTFAINGIDNFATYANEPLGRMRDFLIQHFNYSMTLSAEDIMSEVYARLSTIVTSSVNSVASVIDFITSAFVALFSVTFIAFFFMKENQLFENGVVILFPQKYGKSVHEAINSSISLMSKYLLGLAAESTIKIIFVTLGLYFIGLDFSTSFIIGLITGVLNVIPYIGPLIGAGIGLIIATASAELHVELNRIIIQMVILLGVFQLIDNIILQPYIYSNSVKAHPLEIFLVILIAGSIAGVWGMLLAIPAYTVIRVFAKIFFNKLMVVQKLTQNLNK